MKRSECGDMNGFQGTEEDEKGEEDRAGQESERERESIEMNEVLGLGVPEWCHIPHMRA